jgi:hypothetical protein
LPLKKIVIIILNKEKILKVFKMSKGDNLRIAKAVKNDEFYTRLEDIEKELKYYKNKFKGKVIFCNCDDPESSNFWKFFSTKFEFFELKKLISTHYVKNGQSYKLELKKDINGDGIIDGEDLIKIALNGNGDFRSEESIEILKEADIIVTNPPFSLFREYIDLLMKYEKDFLVIGSQNAITYKEFFPLLKNNKIWLGNTAAKVFLQPDGTEKKFGNICWFTNLTHKKRYEDIILFKFYEGDEENFPIYDNYNAIEVSKVKNIPIDYKEEMGVPITFLDKYNPEQFEIIGLDRYIKGNRTPNKRFKINNKEKYARIIIKRR